MLVTGFVELNVCRNQVRDNWSSLLVLKPKHALFSGTVFLGDVLYRLTFQGMNSCASSARPVANG